MMTKRWIFAIVFLLFLTTATVASAQSAAASAAGEITKTPLISRGVTSIQTPQAKATLVPRPPRAADNEPALMKLMYQANAKVAMPNNVGIPTAKTSAGVTFGGSVWTVNGLDNVDNFNANGFDLEPPDQGLCAGNSFIIEVINLVTAVYDQNGNLISTTPPLNGFFGVPNDSIADPRCYYDQGSSRWFMTVTDAFSTDIIPGRSFVLIAVSFDANPFDGFNLFAIDTTDDGLNGTPSHPGCSFSGTPTPCLGDQPLLGADNNGVYITTNEFGFLTANGAQIYAISKDALELGIGPLAVHLANLSVGGGLAMSVHPAQSPLVTIEPNAGTEYFLNTLNFNGTSDNRIGVWALTNTTTLNSFFPNVSLQNVVVKVKPYSEPGAAQQEVGPFPQGTASGDPEEALSPDDNRMQQVVFTGKYLYSAITSTVYDGTEFVDGVEVFVVRPGFNTSGTLTPFLKANGYVTVKGQNLIYPAIGVSGKDDGVMTFTLVGPNFFPTAAFVKVDCSGARGNVSVVAQGAAPDDGFTGYFGFPSNIQLAGRWGDYSAAVADGKNVFIATEYISGVRRDSFVNWATSMSDIKTH